MIDIAAIYRELATQRFFELAWEIESAYSVAEFDLVRERILDFERNPLGARLVPFSECRETGKSGLLSKYHWERAYWGRGRMALVS